MKPYFELLFRYSVWANLRTFSAVRTTKDAHVESLPLLAHLLAAEHVWLQRLRRQEPRLAVWPTLDIDRCEELIAENEQGYSDFFKLVQDGQLNDSINYRTSQGHEMVSSIADILNQVFTHGPYHRGQIAKILGRFGGTVPMTDYILFAREHS